jgi:hypothetical protein
VRVKVTVVALCEKGRRVAQGVPPHMIAACVSREVVQDRRQLSIRLDKLSLPRGKATMERQHVELGSVCIQTTYPRSVSDETMPTTSLVPFFNQPVMSNWCVGSQRPHLPSKPTCLVHLHHGRNLSIARFVRQGDVARAEKSLFLGSIPVEFDRLLGPEAGVGQATKRRQQVHRTAAVVIGTRRASRRVTVVVPAESEQHEQMRGRTNTLCSPVQVGTWHRGFKRLFGIDQVGRHAPRITMLESDVLEP